MSVAGEPSYFSRFTVKFVEIMAVGLATAVSGYMVAHLGGFFSSTTPPAVQAVPSAATGPAKPPAPAPAASADSHELHPASVQDVNGAAKPSARATANAPEKTPARNHTTNDNSAAERKGRDIQSVEEQVRAALANTGGGGRPVASPEAPPRAVESDPQPAQRPPIQQAPVQLDPFTPVEIKSRPIAAVEPSVAPATGPQTSPPEQDKNPLAALEKIPALLRSDPPLPADQAPRPPASVGQ